MGGFSCYTNKKEERMVKKLTKAQKEFINNELKHMGEGK